MAREKIKVVAIVPVYKRPDVFRVFAEHFKFPKWVDGEVVIIISDKDKFKKQNVEICCEFGFTMCLKENEPLGDKMNYGIWWADMFGEYDYIMNIGSDDIIDPMYWRQVREWLQDGVDFIGMNQIMAYDVYNDKALKLKIPMCWGGGRFIKKSVIDKTKRKLGYVYTPKMLSGLDTDSQHNIIKMTGVKPTVIDGCYLLDLKTMTNINTYLGIEKIPNEPVTESEIREKYGDLPAKCSEIIRNRGVY